MGEVDSPFVPGSREIAPANHFGPSKVEIVPQVIFPGFNVIPFGSNDLFSFTGFIYRDVPAFSLAVGDVIAFDLREANDVQTRRTIFFAAANKNPAACVYSPTTGQITNPQGIAAASGWTQVVSETQVPQNAFGDAVLGNFELRYTAEAPFTFAGGGLLVGFRGRPPATFVDSNSAGSITGATCTDPSGHLYARFAHLPDQTTGILDVPGTNTGDGTFIGGMIIFPEGGGGGTTTCAEGVSAARALIDQLLPARPFLRALLNFSLTRVQAGVTNAERNFGLLVDLLLSTRLISSQDAAELKNLVAPC
ncbi:MAG TPA: hypothetical protein VFQ21_08625 [Gemmatimonadota bacterium]|nr:hypothetical protein [Gemmatimonadota bacterium]